MQKVSDIETETESKHTRTSARSMMAILRSCEYALVCLLHELAVLSVIQRTSGLVRHHAAVLELDNGYLFLKYKTNKSNVATKYLFLNYI